MTFLGCINYTLLLILGKTMNKSDYITVANIWHVELIICYGLGPFPCSFSINDPSPPEIDWFCGLLLVDQLKHSSSSCNDKATHFLCHHSMSRFSRELKHCYIYSILVFKISSFAYKSYSLSPSQCEHSVPPVYLCSQSSMNDQIASISSQGL